MFLSASVMVVVTECTSAKRQQEVWSKSSDLNVYNTNLVTLTVITWVVWIGQVANTPVKLKA